MKKVFSKEKYIENMGEETRKFNWIEDCDSKTVEECHKLGFIISNDWCVEVEDEN